MTLANSPQSKSNDLSLALTLLLPPGETRTDTTEPPAIFSLFVKLFWTVLAVDHHINDSPCVEQ
jgi:hypothetical protein